MNYQSNYPEEFYKFGKYGEISDDKINEWVEDCVNQLEENKKGNHSSYASGNTKVTVDRFYHDETSNKYYYAITVSKGYEEKNIYPIDEE